MKTLMDNVTEEMESIKKGIKVLENKPSFSPRKHNCLGEDNRSCGSHLSPKKDSFPLSSFGGFKLPSERKSSTHKKSKVDRLNTSMSEEIKKNLESLESYSLKSSEEINELIETLTNCILQNTQALEKSLEDLSQISKKNSNNQNNEIERGANKILTQFEQFQEYI